MTEEERRRSGENNYMENKKFNFVLWGLIAVGIAAIVLGMVGFITKTPESQLSVSINSGDNSKNLDTAKAVLVEYSDFQCPACKYFYTQLKNLESDFGKDLGVVYRNFPLSQHQYSFLAAQAAESAAKQGKFWEMHDLIFENQDTWSQNSNARAIFISYAQNLKLDIVKFESDLDSSDVKNKIENDLSGGESAKINATPTFFLNGKIIQNPQNYEEFKKLIEESLQNKK